MGPVQVVSTIIAAAVTIAAVVLAVRTVGQMVRVIRLGQPDPERFDRKGQRAATMLGNAYQDGKQVTARIRASLRGIEAAGRLDEAGEGLSLPEIGRAHV